MSGTPLDICTKCGEPFTDIEERLIPGSGPRHRACPTLDTWRTEAVKWCQEATRANARIRELEGELQRLRAIYDDGDCSWSCAIADAKDDGEYKRKKGE